MDFIELKSMNPFDLLIFLMKIGIVIPEKTCMKCNRKCSLKKRSNVPEKFAWRCTNCTKFYSVKDGSFFQKFKLPILTVLEVIDYWAKERSQNDMFESLKISKPILVKICHFLRQLCFIDLDKDNFRLGGPQKIVEIDESVFNKVKYNKDYVLKKNKLKHKAKFTTDEFILRRNRIKNINKLIEDFNDGDYEENELSQAKSIPVSLVSRSTQTDASSFNYKPRRKTSLIEIEADKYFDSNRQVAEIFTQTEWSFLPIS